MFSHLFVNSAWINRKVELITRHDLEQTELLKQEEVIWRALERTHREQRIQLGNQPINVLTKAGIIGEQTLEMNSWHTDKQATRQEMTIRQERETATLERER